MNEQEKLTMTINDKLDRIISMLEEQNARSVGSGQDPRTLLQMFSGMGDIVSGVHGGDIGSAVVAVEKMKAAITEQIEQDKEEAKKRLKSKMVEDSKEDGSTSTTVSDR